jgi:cold-inducible RNA-binding protein
MTSIFVGNLSYDVSEDELRSAFERYGKVSSVRIITDRTTGCPRGFAFVEMPHLDDADEAINRLHGRPLGGRSNLVVNEAESRTVRRQVPDVFAGFLTDPES